MNVTWIIKYLIYFWQNFREFLRQFIKWQSCLWLCFIDHWWTFSTVLAKYCWVVVKELTWLFFSCVWPYSIVSFTEHFHLKLNNMFYSPNKNFCYSHVHSQRRTFFSTYRTWVEPSLWTHVIIRHTQEHVTVLHQWVTNKLCLCLLTCQSVGF